MIDELAGLASLKLGRACANAAVAASACAALGVGTGVTGFECLTILLLHERDWEDRDKRT